MYFINLDLAAERKGDISRLVTFPFTLHVRFTLYMYTLVERAILVKDNASFTFACIT
jgi:hypothetical protein